MRKNVASQTIGAQMVAAADGSAFTSAVTVHVTGDGGTQATGSVGSGACVHEGNGYHSYAPAQAETNYDHIAFTFIGTGAIPATVQVYTEFPQTGDAFARIGAAGAGLTDLATAAAVADLPTNAELATALGTADDAVLSAIGDLPTNAELATALASADDAVLSAIDALPTAVENADAMLNRDMSAVSDTNARSPLNALRFLRNKWDVAGGTLTVTKENDSTTAWTASVTSDPAAEPVIGSDPA
jgi:flagellar hook-associated protein FlgK